MDELVLILFVCAKFIYSQASLEDISCTFGADAQRPLCNYEIIASDNGLSFDHRQKSADEMRTFNGPIRGLHDRSNYLSFSEGTTRLKTQSRIPLSGLHCLSLDYYLYGPKAYINIYAERDNRLPRDGHVDARDSPARLQDYHLFSRNEISSYVDRWQHTRTTLNFNESNYEIFINAYTSLSGTLALDNLRFTEGACPTEQTGNQHCDFEGVIGSADDRNFNCDWLTSSKTENSQHGQFNWIVRSMDDYDSSGLALDSRLHFFGDHTTQHGFGAYLEGFISADLPNNTLELSIKELGPDDGAHCLSFWIWMVDTEAIWEVTETAIATNHTNILLSPIETDDYPSWHLKSVDIDPVVPMVVKLRLLDGYRLKLDDFKMEKGRCPEPMKCDFRKNMCGMRRGHFDRIDLYIGNGRLITSRDSQLNVNYDHGYLYSELTNTTDNTARLNTEGFKGVGDFCYRFSFTAEPSTRIEVATLTGTYGNTFNLMQVSNYNETGPWKMALADIPAHGKVEHAFRVFVSFTGNENSTIARIREAALETGKCSNYLNKTVPVAVAFQEVQFHCYQTGHYIPQYRSCDGVIDCPMGEDEGEYCDTHNCAHGGIPCKRRGHLFCLNDVTQFCNGNADCDDGVDEDPRMCSAESFCDNYCLNNGECDSTNFNCNCQENFSGKRCSLSE